MNLRHLRTRRQDLMRQWIANRGPFVRITDMGRGGSGSIPMTGEIGRMESFRFMEDSIDPMTPAQIKFMTDVARPYLAAIDPAIGTDSIAVVQVQHDGKGNVSITQIKQQDFHLP